MFPFVVVTSSGLKSGTLYTVEMHIVCADSLRYKYTDSRWHSINRTDVRHDKSRMKYLHPFTPALGEHLNNRPLDFKCMKLTHYSRSKNGDMSTMLLIHFLMSITIRFYYTQCTNIWWRYTLKKRMVKNATPKMMLRKQAMSLDSQSLPLLL